MDASDARAEIENDLAWRLDEIRYLRNELIGGGDRNAWPVSAMRAILVMQYAHLEGFARNSFAVYVQAVNSCNLKAHEVHPNIFASALVPEFNALRNGAGSEPEAEGSRLMRRAVNQVDFISKIRHLEKDICRVEVESAVSMEMNFGSDVFRRTLYRLGIPEGEVSKAYYNSLEFVRKMRNDIAHGSRRERIEPGEFEANQRQCERFMSDLAQLISRAIAAEWFRAQPVV
jgi:RiboL-PSP-HEPN